jgi:SAM-dependent methyltransferase
VERVRAKGYENVEVVEAVNEALPYADGIADRYVANMSLHIVEFPERMVAEAFRVLMPGGIAAFSIVGDRDKSSMPSITLQLIDKYGTEHYLSPFHLSDLETFKQLLKTAGFTRIVTFEEMCHVPVLDLVQLEGSITRSALLSNVYEGLDEEKKAALHEDLHASLQSIIEVRGEPLGVHARLAIAFKL